MRQPERQTALLFGSHRAVRAGAGLRTSFGGVGTIEVMERVNHTGRELELMLAQKKPLAWFTFSEDFDTELVEVHRLAFEPHVKAGEIVECCFGEEIAFDPRIGRRLKMRTYLYALPGEEWRIPAMRLVLVAHTSLTGSGKVGPNEAIDRIMGALLGYSEAETEAYVSVGKHSQVARITAEPGAGSDRSPAASGRTAFSLGAGMIESRPSESQLKKRLSWKQAIAYLIGATIYGGLLWTLDHYFYVPISHDSVLAWHLPILLFILTAGALEWSGWFSDRPVFLVLSAVVAALAIEISLIPIARLFIS